ncbi:carboxypeptidase regulatory-like domain-containing protein [Shewanella sp. SR44-3]|nr:carboxypeptidase regulatory-like domain-containing protein [Shewanella sp. SR44-3]
MSGATALASKANLQLNAAMEPHISPAPSTALLRQSSAAFSKAAASTASLENTGKSESELPQCQRPVNRIYVTEQGQEEHFIVTQLNYGKTMLSEDMFAYQQGTNIYLPLQFLAEQLMLPLQVEMDDLSATGWFLAPKNAITLSQNLMQYLSHNHDCNADATTVFFDDWDLYVDQAIIEQMFGLKVNFDTARQRFELKEQLNIPLSQLLARQQRYQLFKDQKKHGKLQSRTVKNRYAQIGDVALHIDIGARSQSVKGETKQNPDGFIQSRADILGHSSYLGYSWSEQGSNLNAYIEKNLQDSWVKHYRLGSVNSHNLALVNNGSFGQGLVVSAGDNFDTDFRHIVVEGENEPDWDVELYRNNSLISVQRVGSDGRYRFEEVPYFIGLNQYQLRFFGPNGENRIESFSKLLDPSVMEAGSFGVDMGMMQREQDQLKQFYASANWAVSDNITTALALVQQEVATDDWLMTPKLSVSLVGDASVLQANLAHNDSGSAASLVVQGSGKLLDWQAQWDSFDGFISWDNPNGHLKQAAGLNVSGNISNSHLSWSLAGLWREQLLGSDSSQLSATLSGQYQQFSLSNTLSYWVSAETKHWSNRLSLSGRMDDWYLRNYIDVGLSPELKLNQWVINASKAINDAVNYQFELIYQPQVPAPYAMRNTLSYFLDEGAVRLALENNSSGDWSAQLKWSSSLLYMPDENQWHADRISYLNTGSIKIIAFQDDNNDGIRNPDEVGIAGLTFSGHRDASNNTDDNGELLLTHLQTSRPHKLVLNDNSLPDPFLVPRDRALSIEVHPGNVQEIYYPVLFTAELEGEAYFDNDTPAKGTLVTLTHKASKESHSARVEYDGIFIFERLMPGEYELAISPRAPSSTITQTVTLKPGDFFTLAPLQL